MTKFWPVAVADGPAKTPRNRRFLPAMRLWIARRAAFRLSGSPECAREIGPDRRAKSRDADAVVRLHARLRTSCRSAALKCSTP
jgi:hypothetical protein